MWGVDLFSLVWIYCLSACRSLSCCPSCPLADSAPAGHFLTPSLHNWTVFSYSFCASISCVSAFQVVIFKGYLGTYEDLLPPFPHFLLIKIDWSWSCGRWSLEVTSISGTLFFTGQFSRKAFQTDPYASQKAKVHWSGLLDSFKITTLQLLLENLAFPAH